MDPNSLSITNYKSNILKKLKYCYLMRFSSLFVANIFGKITFCITFRQIRSYFLSFNTWIEAFNRKIQSFNLTLSTIKLSKK